MVLRSIMLGVLVIALKTAGAAHAIELPEVAAELERRRDADQEARALSLSELEALDDARCNALRQTDRDNTAWLKRVVDAHGWLGRSLVGGVGANHAWLLVQHADHDPAFQRRCLELMKVAPEGEVAAEQIAYLEDRVLCNAGNPQRYGTQLEVIDGQLIPKPLIDAGRVDEWRAEVGLPPLAEYLQMAKAGLRAAEP